MQDIINEGLKIDSNGVDIADLDNTGRFLAGYIDENGTRHVDFEFTEITGRVEEILAKPQIRNNAGKVINTLLEECLLKIGDIEKSSVKPRDWSKIIKSLYTGDQDLAAAEIRRYSIGNEIEFSHSCPSCKEKLKTILDVDNLDVKEFLGEDEIVTELPRGVRDKEGNLHREVVLRLPKGIDREILGTIKRKDFNKAPRLMLERLVSRVGDLPVSSKLFQDMGTLDFSHLITVVSENSFGYDFNIGIECIYCGYSFDMNIAASNFI